MLSIQIPSFPSTDETVMYIWEMLDSFGIQLYYDPDREQVNKEDEDDLFVYCKDMIERFLLNLAFDMCEAEGDSEGLRTVRRIMVIYFLNSNNGRLNSKYASFTLIDLVVELSESERTRKRMDLYSTINPSGTAGGGLFRDTFMEHCIRAVKMCLRSANGMIDDIKLEKEVGGLSVISSIIEHDRNCALRGKLGKEHAKDMVGPEVREQLEENVAKYNPFDRKREKVKFKDKPFGGPFNGLAVESIDRFIDSKKREYIQKY